MGRDTGSGIRTRSIAYQPLPSQLKFHNSKARFKGFSGPIGSGKSQALCQEAVKLSYLNAGRLGLLGAPTYPMLRDATILAFLEILGQNSIPYDLNKAENVLTLKDTGSRILFRSLDEFERLRGTNLAWFGVDELTYTAEEAWLRLEGRLRDPRAGRLCGYAVWTPKGFDWVYRRFIAEKVDGYEATIARPYENRHLLDKVPDFYERLKRSYDQQFFEQEVLGEYLNSNSGLVYHTFKRREHVREVEVDDRRPLLWALDFNVDPMSSVVVQIEDEVVRVVDEIVMSRASTEQACQEFWSRYEGHRAGVIIYGDASGNHMQTTGSTDYEVIRRFFQAANYNQVQQRVPRANPQVRERIMLVNAKLKPAEGQVQMLISPRCRELVKDFEEVAFKAGSTVVDKDKDPRRTHLSDALGYLVWQECRPRAPIGEQGRRLI